MVQHLDLLRIQRAWRAAGNKPCMSPCANGELSKEYHFGMDGGDYGCSVCGEAFSYSEYQAWRRDRGLDPGTLR